MRDYDYQNSIGFIIRRTAKAFESSFDQQLRNTAGITVTQSRVIGTLVLVKDGMTQKEIADRIGVEAPTIVPVIDKLEEQGLVQRKPDPKDRRNNLIFLTSKSEAKWATIVECALEIEKASCQGLSNRELEISVTTLRKIAQNIAGLSLNLPDQIKSRSENNVVHVRKQQHLQQGKQRVD